MLAPFAGCRLCGAIYQSNYDRNLTPGDTFALTMAVEERRVWSYEHARTHDPEEHIALEESGEFLTPLARQTLQGLGVIPA